MAGSHYVIDKKYLLHRLLMKLMNFSSKKKINKNRRKRNIKTNKTQIYKTKFLLGLIVRAWSLNRCTLDSYCWKEANLAEECWSTCLVVWLYDSFWKIVYLNKKRVLLAVCQMLRFDFPYIWRKFFHKQTIWQTSRWTLFM